MQRGSPPFSQTFLTILFLSTHSAPPFHSQHSPYFPSSPHVTTSAPHSPSSPSRSRRTSKSPRVRLYHEFHCTWGNFHKNTARTVPSPTLSATATVTAISLVLYPCPLVDSAFFETRCTYLFSLPRSSFSHHVASYSSLTKSTSPEVAVDNRAGAACTLPCDFRQRHILRVVLRAGLEIEHCDPSKKKAERTCAVRPANFLS